MASNPAKQAILQKAEANSSDINVRAKSSAQSAESAMEKLKQARIVVDDAGKAFIHDPATGEVSEVPGAYRKLVDIFHQISGKASDVAGKVGDAVGDVAEKAKGLVANPKVVPTGNAAMGRGAPAAVGKGASKLGTMVDAGLGASKMASGVGAFLALMADSSPANAGEDERLTEIEKTPMPGQEQAQPEPTSLDNQSQQVLDKGINTAAKPTMEPDRGPDPRPKTELGAAMPQAATMTDNHTGKLGQNTGGGFYPVYEKNSGEAQDFRSAFSKALASGLPTFSWQGREYTTEVKKDAASAGPVTQP